MKKFCVCFSFTDPICINWQQEAMSSLALTYYLTLRLPGNETWSRFVYGSCVVALFLAEKKTKYKRKPIIIFYDYLIQINLKSYNELFRSAHLSLVWRLTINPKGRMGWESNGT